MKKSLLPVCIIVIVILSCCNSTKIVHTWKEQGKEIVMDKLNKVLVVALFKDSKSRRIAEDEMVGYLGRKGIVSYLYLPETFNKSNEDSFRQKIQEDGFDGAVTMRLVDADREMLFTTGSIIPYPIYNRSFSGFFYRNWSSYANPGYYSATRHYRVETDVYSIKEDRIIWSGITETINAGGLKKMAQRISDVVFTEMVEGGFIAE